MVWPILISVAVTPRISAAGEGADHSNAASTLAAPSLVTTSLVTKCIGTPPFVWGLRNGSRQLVRFDPTLSSKHAMMGGWTPTTIMVKPTRKAAAEPAGSLKPLRHYGVRHQRPDTVAVERHDEEQIDLPEDIVHGSYRRDDHTRRIAVDRLQHREPEIQVLVVATCNYFIVANEEDRPGSDFFADAVFAPDGGLHDLCDSRSFQPEARGCRITGNQ